MNPAPTQGGRERRPRSIRLALACLAAAALMAGCSEEAPEADATAAADSAESGAAQGAGAPRLEVSADKTHAVQPGDDITVTVEGSSPAPSGARYRAYLDDADGDDFLAASADPTFQVSVPEGLTDGSHKLRVVLYDGDAPVEPRTEGSVWLIVYRLD